MVKAETGYKWKFPDGNWQARRSKYKRTELILNPNFKLDDFVPKALNGWKVKMKGVYNSEYTWQDSKVVDSNGKVIMDFSKKGKSK